MKAEPCKYVLKLTDNLYNSWGYCLNGVIDVMGTHGFFLEESVFNTYEEAKRYIAYLLSTGWYRKDITESSFEVVDVWKRKDSKIDPFWYTDEELKRFDIDGGLTI